MKLNNKGFTLIELIATIAIITLLTIVIAPSILKNINTGKNKSYEILVANIVTASQELYEEVYTNKLMLGDAAPELYKYDATEYKPTTKIEIVQEDDSISINLQTLVSNGFLSGKNEDGKKIITNPKLDNIYIGACEIKISRTKNDNGKVTYVVEAANDSASYCPTTDDYKKGVK